MTSTSLIEDCLFPYIVGTCPDEESAGGSEIPLDAATEEVSLPSAPLDVAEDLPNGHSQVEDEKVDIHDSPKTAVPILSGWAQAVMKGRVHNVETVPTGKFCVCSTIFSFILFVHCSSLPLQQVTQFICIYIYVL